MSLLVGPKFMGFDANGDPLSGGKLYTYAAGTTTAKVAYTDPTLLVAHANPIILDSRGEALVYFSGTYKLILTTSADVTIWTIDNVEGSGSVNVTKLSSYADLVTAVSVIGATESTLYIDKDDVMTANVIVPTTMQLHFLKGNIITTTGYTLTLYSPDNIIASPNQQIFAGTGTVTFTNGGGAYTGWLGGDTAWDDAVTYSGYAALEHGSYFSLGLDSDTEYRPPIWIQKKFGYNPATKKDYVGLMHLEMWRKDDTDNAAIVGLSVVVNDQSTNILANYADTFAAHFRAIKEADSYTATMAQWLHVKRAAGATSGFVQGMEVNVENYVDSGLLDSVFDNTPDKAEMGIWIAALYGDSPSTCAIGIYSDSGIRAFYNGILFETVSIHSTGTAINMKNAAPKYGIKFGSVSLAAGASHIKVDADTNLSITCNTGYGVAVAGKGSFTEGVATHRYLGLTTDPPTAAELTAVIGDTPANKGTGWFCTVNNGTYIYLVMADTTFWHYEQLSAAL